MLLSFELLFIKTRVMKKLIFVLSILIGTVYFTLQLVAQNHDIAYSIPPNKSRVYPGSKPFRVENSLEFRG